MLERDRKKLLQKFGKTNFGEKEIKKTEIKKNKKKNSYSLKEFEINSKPVSAFNMGRIN